MSSNHKPRAMSPDNRVPYAAPAEDWKPLNMSKWQHLRSDLWRRPGGTVPLTDSRNTQGGNDAERRRASCLAVARAQIEREKGGA